MYTNLFKARKYLILRPPTKIKLCTNVSIHKGGKIQKGSIIGANAVVTKDTHPYSINVGIPAKKIGERT